MNKHVKFDFIPVDRGRNDKSGDLRITTLTDTGFLAAVEYFDVLDKVPMKEIMELFKKREYSKLLTGLDPEKAKALPTFLRGQEGSDYEAFYKQEDTLEDRFFKPYASEYRKRTGMKVPDQYFPEPNKYGRCGLCHTHYLERMEIKGGELTCAGYVRSGDWWGKTAGERSASYFHHAAMERFVHRPPVQEHIDCGNGIYRRNPKYGTGFKHDPVPKLEDDYLFKCMMEHWIENFASDRQKELIEKDTESMKGARCESNIFSTMSGGDELRTGWETGETVSWAEFVRYGNNDTP